MISASILHSTPSPRLSRALEARPPRVGLIERSDGVLQSHLRELHRHTLQALVRLCLNRLFIININQAVS